RCACQPAYARRRNQSLSPRGGIVKARIAAALAVGAMMATLVAAPAEATTPELHFSYAIPNGAGPDHGSNKSLNAEWIRIKNSSATHTYNLTGYSVRDEQHHVYKFGHYLLHPGQSVIIHTGRGTNTHANR